MTQEWFGRRFTALLVVLALHLLFLLLLLAREPITRRVAHGDQSSVLFFIETPRSSVTTATPVPSRPAQSQPTVVDVPSTPEQTTIAPSPETPAATIDWTAQAAQSAA